MGVARPTQRAASRDHNLKKENSIKAQSLCSLNCTGKNEYPVCMKVIRDSR